MARQAEAEREKRAKIIAAEGEALAADKLGVAADIMMSHPLALQLRNLQSPHAGTSGHEHGEGTAAAPASRQPVRTAVQ